MGQPLDIADVDFASVPKALMAHALDTFGDAQRARSWFSTPNAALDDQPPILLARTAEGARHIEEVLTRIDYGMFS